MASLRWLSISLGFLSMAVMATAGPKIYLGDFYHPKLRGGEVAIRRVIVMPPSIQVQKDTMKGRQSMETEAAKLGPVIDRAVMRALKDNNVVVSEATPTDEILADRPEERESISNVQRSFDAISPAMLKRLKDVRKGRFKLEQEMPDLKWNESTRSDTLVFVRGYGSSTTKAKQFAKGGGIWSLLPVRLSMNMIITFIDANSGDVLWVKAFIVPVKNDFTETKLTETLDNSFKRDAKKGVFGGRT